MKLPYRFVCANSQSLRVFGGRGRCRNCWSRASVICGVLRGVFGCRWPGGASSCHPLHGLAGEADIQLDAEPVTFQSFGDDGHRPAANEGVEHQAGATVGAAIAGRFELADQGE